MTTGAVLLLLAAPAIGSFLGVLVLRLPEGRPVLLGRSACPDCGTVLGARDLVPVLSWLWRRGRCRHCGAAIPAFYPAMELAALGVALWAAAVVGTGPEALAALVLTCLLGWGLLALAVTDWRVLLLPDALTLPLIALGLGATFRLDAGALADHAIGAVAGWGAFAGLAWLYRILRGREGLGGGDATLLAAGGAWLGWAALPGVVLLASLLGLAEALLRRVRPGEEGGAGPAGPGRIAFGPWLAAAIWLSWLYGPLIAGS